MTSEALVETGVISCPEPGCMCDQVHPVGVEVNSGGVITDVDSSGTKITRGEADGRGVTILLRLQCEWGHASVVRFHFHKGATAFQIIPMGELAIQKHTIWRN